MKRILTLSAFVLFSTISLLRAQVPASVSYQGLLTDGSGNPVSDGDYTLTLKLYDAETGGAVLWEETQTVKVRRGLFNTDLGAGKPLNLPFDKQYWLGISVGGGGEMSPHIRLAAVPYSMVARTIPDSSITVDKFMPGQIVKSVNGRSDHVRLVPGTNIAIDTTGADITISASGAAGSGDITAVRAGQRPSGRRRLRQCDLERQRWLWHYFHRWICVR